MKHSDCLFNPYNPSTRRRGAVAAFTLVMLVVLIGFASLTLDVGVLYNTRADLQRVADAAALAGVSAYASETSLGNHASVATERAQLVANRNDSFGASGTTIESGDVTTGWIDVASADSPIDPTQPPSTHNAVQVIVHRSNEGSNGPVQFLFAPIFGKQTGEVSASAVAVYDDRISGYDPEAPGAADAWPFTVAKIVYDQWVDGSGNDAYGFDGDSGNVTQGADGTREIRMYPDNLAPGNYGLLNIGTPNQSQTILAEQITNGVIPEDFESEIGTSEITFLNDQGDPTSYDITGNPGLKSSLESSISSRVGDIIAFFLHDHEQVDGSGSNTVYRVINIRFARVMDVRLQGSQASRGLWVQPIAYTGPGVITNPEAPSSDGAAGKFVLAR